MPSIIDSIKIQLGLDTSELDKNLARSKENVNKTSSELARGSDRLTSSAVGQLGNIAKMIAMPMAGALTIGGMIKNYFGGVAQVAQMTGAYSPKLEEWRKKRALLNRTTAEDVRLYKKSREALTSFQISLSDVGAKIMRQASPAFEFFANTLLKVSKWVDNNSDDLVRFVTVLGGVIAGVLTPSIVKMTIAMLANPIGLIIAGIVALGVAIDDFIVWLKGGESALSSFWSLFGDNEKVLQSITSAIDICKETFKKLWDGITDGVNIALKWLSDLWSDIDGNAKVVAACEEIWKTLQETFDDISAVLTAVFTPAIQAVQKVWELLVHAVSETSFLDDMKNAFNSALDVVLGLFDLFYKSIHAIWGLIRGVITGDWSSLNKAVDDCIKSAKKVFEDFKKYLENIFKAIWKFVSDIFVNIGKSIADAFSFDKIKEKLSGITKVFPFSLFADDEETKANIEDLKNTLDQTKAVEAQNNKGGSIVNKDSHAVININTDNPEVAQRAVDQFGYNEQQSDLVENTAMAVF